MLSQLDHEPKLAETTELRERANHPRDYSPRLFEIVNEFAEETGIFGPSILRSGLSSAEGVFWILCTLFFACCTVRDLTNLTRPYLQEDTVSLVRQKAKSSFFLSPAPTIAIQHGLDQAMFDFRHLPTMDELDDFLLQFENTTADNDTKVATSALSPALTELMATMLHEIVARELPTAFATFDTATYGILERESSFAIVQPFVEQAFRRLRSRNIDFSKLLKLVIAVLCARADFAVSCCDCPGSEAISPCTPANVLSFDDVGLGLRLSTTDFTFTGPEDLALISWNAASPIGTTFSPEVVVDLSGSPQTMWENENSLTRISYDGRRGQRFVVSLALSAVFLRAKEKTLEPCSTTISSFDCKQHCYINRFVKQCRCYPLYFAAAYPPPLSATFPLCPNSPMNESETITGGIIDYVVNCSRINDSETWQLDDRCKSQCLPDCMTQTFVTTVEQSPSFSNSSRNELELRVQTFTFPVFEEKLSMNFESFISQFGGILGLYIGISFAALVHVPIFAIRKALQRFRRPGSAAKRRANIGKPSDDSRIVEMSSTVSQSADVPGPSARYKRVHNEQLEQRVSALELEVQSLVDVVKSSHQRFSAE